MGNPFKPVRKATCGIVESCGLVDRALDSRSKGLGVDFHCWSYVEVLGNFSWHAASAYPAMTITLVTDGLNRPTYVYDVCAVFFQGRRDCSRGVLLMPGKLTGQRIW